MFITFQKLVENQLNTNIKVFQSDGGGEFTSNQLKKHLMDSDIQHRISCPYTPQQNGVAEKKHRHLIELGLSMLFHNHTHLQFWVEAFFTACFLGNLLPSSVLDSHSPFEVLFNQKPDYSMLRVFGSVCYPCLRPLASHKFDPRSLQCIFLGYSSQYKGYMCLYPTTGKVCIFRHVIFNEDWLPFKHQFQSLAHRYETPLLKAWKTGSLSPMPHAVSPAAEISPIQISSRTATPADHEPATINLNDQLIQVEESSSTDTTAETSSSIETEAETEGEPATAPVTEVVQQDTTHPMTTRSKDGIFKPNTRYVLLASKFIPEEPKNYCCYIKTSWMESSCS